MNREERRNLMKKGATKDTVDKLKLLQQPCSIQEAVVLARSAAEDVCSDLLSSYKQDNSRLLMALTIQVDLLKKVLIESGILTEESFQEKYLAAAKEFEDKQREYLESLKSQEESTDTVDVGMKSDVDIEIKEEK